MKKRLVTIALAILLALSITTSALAQSYSFSLDKEVVNVYWNSDGSMSLDYVFTFSNQLGAHTIDFVDVGLPNDNYDSSTITADVNGDSVGVDASGYQGSGAGIAVDMGSHAIGPGQTGSVHVFVGKITQVIHPDDKDQNYASADFSPTWFGSQYVVGTTDLRVTYHFPPGVKPEEPRWHSAPSGFPSEPQTGFDSENRITYTWENAAASGSRQYTFGASFPKSYIPADAIVTAPAFNFAEWIGTIIGNIVPFGFCGFIIFMFVGIPILNAIGSQRRKLQYMSPRIAIECHGIKRGLTAVEAAILMGQPLDKVMTMILFGVVKKSAATVTNRDPLTVQVTSPMPEGLHDYEVNFLNAVKENDQ